MIPAKKILLYVAVFVVGFAVTYGLLFFFFQYNKEPEPITLKVVGLWDSEEFKPLQEQFEEANPLVTLVYEKKDPENYFPTLSSELKTETGPDLFWWHSGWTPTLASELSPLPEEVMSSKDFEKTFYPITEADLKFSGSYHGFPLEIDGLALLYNKATFASTNFREPPKTWSSLKGDYVPSLTKYDKQRVLNSAIALGASANVENAAEIIGLLLLQNDVVFTEKGKVVLMDNKNEKGTNLVADALDFYADFSRRDHTWDNTQPNSIEAFAKGKTAMIMLPAHKIPKLLDYIKKENLSLDFAVAPVPQLPNSKTVTWGSYWNLGVSKNSPKKEQAAAWQLAKFLTSEESLKSFYTYESAKQVVGRAYPRVSMAKEQVTNPYLSAYLEQAQNAKSWYLHSDTFDKALNDNLVSEFKKTLTTLEGPNKAEGELKDLVAAITPILQKYKVTTLTIGK